MVIPFVELANNMKYLILHFADQVFNCQTNSVGPDLIRSLIYFDIFTFSVILFLSIEL